MGLQVGIVRMLEVRFKLAVFLKSHGTCTWGNLYKASRGDYKAYERSYLYLPSPVSLQVER